MSIENIQPSFVPVEIAGKVRNLKYTMSAVAYLAKRYQSLGGAIQKFFDLKLVSDLDIDQITILLDFIFAGLKHEDKTLTPDSLAEMLDLASISVLVVKVGEALKLSFPAVKKVDPPLA